MQKATSLNEAMKYMIDNYGPDPLENGKLYAYISDCGYIANNVNMKECFSALSSSGVAKDIYNLQGSKDPQKLCQGIISNFLSSNPNLNIEYIKEIAAAILFADGITLEMAPIKVDTSKHRKPFWVWIIATLVLAGLSFGIVATIRHMFPKQEKDVVLPSYIEGQIEGYYSVRISNQDDNITLTGQISKTTSDSFTIYIVTEYGPKYYTFSINNNLEVTSEQLGEGTLRYRKDINKTTITFEKNETICELSK